MFGYVTWKIIPKLDYPNKEGIFITVYFRDRGQLNSAIKAHADSIQMRYTLHLVIH